MNTITIPKGQRVRIRKYDADTAATHDVNFRGGTVRDIRKQKGITGINDTSFILMEPVVFNVSSSFESLIKTEKPSLSQYAAGEALKAFGADTASGIITGVTEYSGFQRWSSTDLLELELSLCVISQGDAYNDVVMPMLNLIKLILPTVNTSSSSFINKARTLRLPGPSIMKVINSIYNTHIGSDSTYTESDTEFTICVGNLIFDHVIITGVTPTIMPDTDVNGYPLSVFLKLKFKGTRIPNNEMVDQIFSGWEE